MLASSLRLFHVFGPPVVLHNKGASIKLLQPYLHFRCTWRYRDVIAFCILESATKWCCFGSINNRYCIYNAAPNKIQHNEKNLKTSFESLGSFARSSACSFIFYMVPAANLTSSTECSCSLMSRGVAGANVVVQPRPTLRVKVTKPKNPRSVKTELEWL